MDTTAFLMNGVRAFLQANHDGKEDALVSHCAQRVADSADHFVALPVPFDAMDISGPTRWKQAEDAIAGWIAAVRP